MFDKPCKETYFPSPSGYQMPVVAQLGVEFPAHLPTPHWDLAGSVLTHCLVYAVNSHPCAARRQRFCIVLGWISRLLKRLVYRGSDNIHLKNK